MDTLHEPAWVEPLRVIATRELLASQAAPGGVLAVAKREPTRRTLSEGRLARSSWRSATVAVGHLAPDDPTPVGLDTVYDLASLTKPFVACAALTLARDTDLLSRPLGSLLKLAQGTASADTPLEALLCHRSGLEAHLELFAPLREGLGVGRAAALVTAANAFRPECDPQKWQASDSTGFTPVGFAPVYSDLGYLLAGAALEEHSGGALFELLQQVYGPWKLTGVLTTAARLEPEPPVAPTEDVPWRGGRICRAVHDENAYALSGLEMCGHAGLFGTASAVLHFGIGLQEVLHSDPNSSPTRAKASKSSVGRGNTNDADTAHGLLSQNLRAALAPRPGGSLRLGFDGRSAEGSSAGSHFGEASFGHLGFTGTSLWCDPSAGLVVVLLTNRVCPTRENIRIRVARPRIHDAVYQLCGASD